MYVHRYAMGWVDLVKRHHVEKARTKKSPDQALATNSYGAIMQATTSFSTSTSKTQPINIPKKNNSLQKEIVLAETAPVSTVVPFTPILPSKPEVLIATPGTFVYPPLPILQATTTNKDETDDLAAEIRHELRQLADISCSTAAMQFKQEYNVIKKEASALLEVSDKYLLDAQEIIPLCARVVTLATVLKEISPTASSSLQLKSNFLQKTYGSSTALLWHKQRFNYLMNPNSWATSFGTTTDTAKNVEIVTEEPIQAASRITSTI